MTRDEIERYVQKLDQEMKDFYFKLDRYVIEAADTATEDFQLAAALHDVFLNRAKAWLEWRS